MSSLNSGMDLVFILSHAYIGDIVARVLSDADPICLTMPIAVPGTRLQVVQINGQAFKNFVPLLDSTRLENQPDGSVHIVLSFRAAAGEICRATEDEDCGPGGDGYRPLTAADRVEWALTVALMMPDGGGPPQLTFALKVNALLSSGLELHDFDILPLLGVAIAPEPLPIDQLERTREVTITADDGTETTETRVVLGFNAIVAQLKAIDAGLCVGVGVGLRRDDLAGFEDQLDIHCDLPAPSVPDVARFRDGFDIRAADLPRPAYRYDWVVALGDHILDALIQVESHIADPGTVTADCDNKGELFIPCMHLVGLETGRIRIAGQGRLFVCEWEGPFGASFWLTFRAHASLVLRRDRSTDSYRAHYEVTRVEVLSPFWAGALMDFLGIDPMDKIPASRRADSIPFDLPTRLGDASNTVGTLNLDDVSIRADGLILQGYGSVTRPRHPAITTPAELLFGRACDGTAPPVRRTFTIYGTAGLHVCPPVFTGPHAGRFSIVEPPELTAAGRGKHFGEGERSLPVTVELDGDLDGHYQATMVVPNDADAARIDLSADLGTARIDVAPTSLALSYTVDVTPCGVVSDPWGFGEIVTVRNDGQGYLLVCQVSFPENPTNSRGELVFTASRPEFVVRPGQTTTLHTRARLDRHDVGRSFEGKMQLVNNAGAPVEIPLSASLDEHHLLDGDGLVGGVYSDLVDIICAGVDWPFVRDELRNLIIGPDTFERIAGFLGGRPCCPPPHDPVCQCVDLLGVTLENIPTDRGLILYRVNDQASDELIRTTGPAALLAFNPENRYALAVRAGPNDHFEDVVLRVQRWMLRQDALYESDVLVHDIAVARGRLYLATEAGLDILGWQPGSTPVLVDRIEDFAGTVRLEVMGEKDLLLYSKEGYRLVALGVQGPETEIATYDREIIGQDLCLPSQDRYGPYGFGIAGPEIRVLDLSDVSEPKLVGSFDTNIEAERGLTIGNWLVLTNRNMLAAYDVTNPVKPKQAGLWEYPFESRHVLAAGAHVFAIGLEAQVATFGFEPEGQLRQLAEMKTEAWLRPYLPASGKIAAVHNHTIVIGGDGKSLRLMQILDNVIDQEAIAQVRDSAN